MKRAAIIIAPLLLGTVRGVEADKLSLVVTAIDGGVKTNAATWECTRGHKVEKHGITLDNGRVRYSFRASGCTDPSHGDKRPCSEGNFGMPEPTTANWYWGGFFQALVNGTPATAYRVKDMRVIERGTRAGFQILWEHPDAEVGLRILLQPDANHVLAELVWRPRPKRALEKLTVRLTCYPSFFTAARHRAGARHCQTPRIDMSEPETLDLIPEQDTYLYYYDAIFDVAKGEGSGPCAVLLAPGALSGGRVRIGDYAVQTELRFNPSAGEARLAFYDFTGQSNAAAEAYLKEHAARDLSRLIRTDFRPQSVRTLDITKLSAEANQLLADAAEDGRSMRPQIAKLISQAKTLKAAADAGDWIAEAKLASLLDGSADMLWKLRAFAVLNAMTAAPGR